MCVEEQTLAYKWCTNYWTKYYDPKSNQRSKDSPKMKRLTNYWTKYHDPKTPYDSSQMRMERDRSSLCDAKADSRKNKRCWRQTSQLPRRQKLRGGPPNPTEQSGEEVRRFCIESGAQRLAAENSIACWLFEKDYQRRIMLLFNEMTFILLTLPVNGGCVKCNPVAQQQTNMQRNLAYPVEVCIDRMLRIFRKPIISFSYQDTIW